MAKLRASASRRHGRWVAINGRLVVPRFRCCSSCGQSFLNAPFFNPAKHLEPSTRTPFPFFEDHDFLDGRSSNSVVIANGNGG